jgi:methyl-accepting chemotaxis protein
MLSLNVSIEAARVGEAGKGFSLIAAEIRKLAKEVQELSTDVQTRVQALMHTVTVELKDRAQQRQESEQVSIQNLSETLGSLTDNLTAVVAYQRDTLQKVESESSDAVVPIMEIIGSIQFQDTVRKHVEQLQRTARLVDEHIASIAATRDGPQNEAGQISLADKLDEIQGTHETARPRSVDDAATGRRAA